MPVKVVVIKPTKPIFDNKKMMAELTQITKWAVVEGISFMRQYPTRIYISRASVYGQAFVSDRQRRWFFAALARGELILPRVRTMILAKSWHDGSGVKVESGKLCGTIASSGAVAPYNIWVQSAESQSKYMEAMGWQTEDDMLKFIEPRWRKLVNAKMKELARE